jgi:hypothetical protein
MELFGYLCGDTKIYEMIEVFHLQMLQVGQLHEIGQNYSSGGICRLRAASGRSLLRNVFPCRFAQSRSKESLSDRGADLAMLGFEKLFSCWTATE